MRGWSRQSLDWYISAGHQSQYPRAVLKSILPSFKPWDSVLDIGCGPGLFVLPIATLVREVFALDRQETALSALRQQANLKAIKNITCILGDWPGDWPQQQVDVVISAFSGSQVMVRKDSLEKILLSAKREVWLAAPGTDTPPFQCSVPQESHPNGQGTIALLRDLGMKFSSQVLTIDFGQPVTTPEEGSNFLSQFLKISSEQATEHFFQVAQARPWGWYLPNPRNVILIHIQKQQP